REVRLARGEQHLRGPQAGLTGVAAETLSLVEDLACGIRLLLEQERLGQLKLGEGPGWFFLDDLLGRAPRLGKLPAQALNDRQAEAGPQRLWVLFARPLEQRFGLVSLPQFGLDQALQKQRALRAGLLREDLGQRLLGVRHASGVVVQARE